MAKVNLWLRGARGKFAGASLSKGTNGETIAREVVTPANPNTVKQRYQRAIMATVMIMYSAFSEIFDHSFQGKTKGSECQQAFMKENLNMLRANIAADMDTYPTLSAYAAYDKLYSAVVLPKSEYPAPNPYYISKGTYDQYFITIKMKKYSNEEDYDYGGLSLEIPTANAQETIAQYAKRNNLIPGDIYTILALAPNELTAPGNPIAVTAYSSITGDYSYNYREGKNPRGTSTGTGCKSVELYPVWIRMQVKSDVLTNTGAANDNLSTYMEVTELSDKFNIFSAFSSWQNGAFIGRKHTTLNYYIQVLAAGVIRSRLDQDLRSTSKMVCCNNMRPFDSEMRGECYTGITAPCIPYSWDTQTTNLGVSDQILESNT